MKRAAQNGLVRITENGNGAYVFCSEAVYQEKLNEAVEHALYCQRLSETLAAGTAAFERGDYVTGIDEAKAAVAKRRAHRA